MSHSSDALFQCFYATENFVRFVTEAYVTAKVMEAANMADQDGVPEGSVYEADEKARRQYLDALARQVLKDVWLLPSQEDIRQKVLLATTKDCPSVCFCERGNDFCPLHSAPCFVTRNYRN